MERRYYVRYGRNNRYSRRSVNLVGLDGSCDGTCMFYSNLVQKKKKKKQKNKKKKKKKKPSNFNISTRKRNLDPKQQIHPSIQSHPIPHAQAHPQHV